MIDPNKLKEEAASAAGGGLPFFQFEDKDKDSKAYGEKRPLVGIAVDITDPFQASGEFAWKEDKKTGEKYPNMVRDWIFENDGDPFTLFTKKGSITVVKGDRFRLQNGSRALLAAYAETPYKTGDLVRIMPIGSGTDRTYHITVIKENAKKIEPVSTAAKEVFEETEPSADELPF